MSRSSLCVRADEFLVSCLMMKILGTESVPSNICTRSLFSSVNIEFLKFGLHKEMPMLWSHQLTAA